MGKLDGQVAIVTGASSGMGRETARLFAREGADVAIIARRVDPLTELADELVLLGRRVLPLVVDIADGPAARAMVDQVARALGRIDVVVNNAGTNLPRRAIAVLDPADWEQMLATNLSSAFHVTQAALPHLRQQGGGLLIYVASVSVPRPDVSGVAYQASKHGLRGLAHGTAVEENANGIRTTVLFPGLTDTPLILKRPVPTPAETMAKAMRPEDIAEACLFLASLPARVRVPELSIVPSGLPQW